jgi:transposase
MERPDELIAIAEDIKRLLIVLLLKSGASQGDVAKALGVSEATMSRLLAAPVGKRKKKK